MWMVECSLLERFLSMPGITRVQESMIYSLHYISSHTILICVKTKINILSQNSTSVNYKKTIFFTLAESFHQKQNLEVVLVCLHVACVESRNLIKVWMKTKEHRINSCILWRREEQYPDITVSDITFFFSWINTDTHVCQATARTRVVLFVVLVYETCGIIRIL